MGDKIVLHGDIHQELLDLCRRKVSLPNNAHCNILQQQLGIKALLLQAEKDSIVIGDKAIEEEFEQRVTHHLPMYTHRQIFESPPPSIDQLKTTFKPYFRDQLMVKRMIEKITAPVTVTPREVIQYFMAKNQDSLPFYESEIELGEIIRYPLVNAMADQNAIDTLNKLKSLLLSNDAKFDVLARKYSQDPSTQLNGGLIHLSRKKQHKDGPPQSIIDQVFRLQQGELSPVFKSPFGYHLVLLESKHEEVAIIRHILRIPCPEETSIQQTILTLDSVRCQLINGTITFKAAVSRFSEEPYKWKGGFVQNTKGSTTLQFDDLTLEQCSQLLKDQLKPGDYSAPHVFTDWTGRKAVRLFYLKNQSAPHQQNLRTDYARIAEEALQAKRQHILHKWFASTRSSWLVAIDPAYRTCSSFSPVQWIADLSIRNY